MRERWARGLAAMSGAVVVMLAAGFAWILNATSVPAAPTVQHAARMEPERAPAEGRPVGRMVYDDQRCARCHSIAGEGNPRSPLDGVGSRLDEGQLRKFITGDPAIADELAPRIVAVKRSYASLPAEQLDALVAYLGGLR